MLYFDKKQMKYNQSREYKVEELSSKIAYFKGLTEKGRRLFLAQEYKSLGWGSQRYISKVFGCSRITITRGTRELEGGLEITSIRRAGGGRKKKKR